MTGIVAGAAALIGVALGWWGAVIVTLLAVIFLAVGPNRPSWAMCVVALAAVVVGAWRAETVPRPAQIERAVQGAPSAVVVTAPDLTGERQSFVVTMPGRPGLPAHGESVRICVMAAPVPVVRLGDTLQARGTVKSVADLPMGVRAALTARGCVASLYATSIQVLGASPGLLRGLADLRTQLDTALRRSAPGDAGVLLAGLVTGDDDGFSTARSDAFIRQERRI